LARAEWLFSGIHRRRTAIIHRTVRCTPDCPVGHRSVRCAPDMSGAPTALRLPTVDCKISLPRLLSTAPSCLGAIKGTPRRMEENTKHLLNIPKHQDIDSADCILWRWTADRTYSARSSYRIKFRGSFGLFRSNLIWRRTHPTMPYHICYPVNKIGRDSISYVESLIESIMGGLEGLNLINILDSEGGFGSLEMQEISGEDFIVRFRTENCIQRPSIIESLLRRHLGIIHLAEQHIGMDLTEGIREVLNVVKDASRIGVAFDAIQNCFRSSQPIGCGCLAESFTDKREMKSLVRLFGGYGIDKMDKMLREHTSALLNCIDSALRSNRDALEGLAGTVNSGDRIERDVNLKQIIDLETLADLCIQAGQAMTFLLVEAVGAKVPLIYSLLKGLALQLPDEVPDKNEIIRLRKVASSVGVGDKHDAEWVHSILTDAGAANDNSWILLPYLCAAFMVSNIWNGAVYDVNIGGLSNNLHCLARCVSAVIEGSEYTRVEREQRINSLSNVHTDELQEAELPSRVSAEANIKSSMQIYVKLSAGVVLDSWNDTS
ncbi:hypothetical protein ACJX0J_029473, partial [Zea mays]